MHTSFGRLGASFQISPTAPGEEGDYDPDDLPILIGGAPPENGGTSTGGSGAGSGGGGGGMDPGDEPIGFPSGRGTEDDPIEGEDIEVTVEGTGDAGDAAIDPDVRWTDLLWLALFVGLGWWLLKRSGVLDGVF